MPRLQGHSLATLRDRAPPDDAPARTSSQTQTRYGSPPLEDRMRERIPIRHGDLFRSPDRSTARWHRVIRIGRRKDGSRYITIRLGRFWRLLGFGPLQRLEWASVN